MNLDNRAIKKILNSICHYHCMDKVNSILVLFSYWDQISWQVFTFKLRTELKYQFFDIATVSYVNALGSNSPKIYLLRLTYQQNHKKTGAEKCLISRGFCIKFIIEKGSSHQNEKKSSNFRTRMWECSEGLDAIRNLGEGTGRSFKVFGHFLSEGEKLIVLRWPINYLLEVCF